MTDRVGRRPKDKYAVKFSAQYRREREKELASLRTALIQEAQQRLQRSSSSSSSSSQDSSSSGNSSDSGSSSSTAATLQPQDALSPLHADAQQWLAALQLWQETGAPPYPEL